MLFFALEFLPGNAETGDLNSHWVNLDDVILLPCPFNAVIGFYFRTSKGHIDNLYGQNVGWERENRREAFCLV